MTKRVVLAYSGGLDTSVAIRWMIEEWGVEVIGVLVNVGQDVDSSESFDDIRDRALAAGAVDFVLVDARREMAEEFCAKAILANARYENKYPLVSALSRPVIVRHLVAEARTFGAQAVAHGCTGKGNDQVRFEVGTHALAPDLEVLAPARNWGMTRADSVDYAMKWDIPIKATKEKIYSIDENLWGRAIECGAIEDPWDAPPEEPYTLTRVTNLEPVELTVSFAAVSQSRSTASRWRSPTSFNSSTRAPARRALVVSTWWRTVEWASRAARCTNARRRWR
jgi:argininosuccinate synthase